jgi:hypothetical protein
MADHSGRMELTSVIEGVRFAGGSEIQVVVVDHGWTRSDRRAARAEALLAWQQSWTLDPARTIGDRDSQGWVAGCATFRPLGGSESLRD